MAQNTKNKKNKIEDDEIIYEEETGSGSKSAASGDGRSIFAKYQNFILGGLLVIVALVFFGPRLGLWGDNKESLSAAQSDMINPAHYYEADSVNRAIQMFSDLEGELGNKKAENLLKFYLGTAYLRAGNVDEGQAYLEKFDKGDNMVSAAAYGSLGAALEEQGNFSEAAGMYLDASKTPEENAYTTPMYLMDAARCYESAGNNSEALELYKRIKYDYPASEEARVIDRYIGRLSGGADA